MSLLCKFCTLSHVSQEHELYCRNALKLYNELVFTNGSLDNCTEPAGSIEKSVNRLSFWFGLDL